MAFGKPDSYEPKVHKSRALGAGFAALLAAGAAIPSTGNAAGQGFESGAHNFDEPMLPRKDVPAPFNDGMVGAAAKWLLTGSLPKSCEVVENEDTQRAHIPDEINHSSEVVCGNATDYVRGALWDALPGAGKIGVAYTAGKYVDKKFLASDKVALPVKPAVGVVRF